MKQNLFILFLIFPMSMFSQLEYSNWYFGGNAGVSFTGANNSPLQLNNSMLNTLEGSSAISTKDGKLLFYTDGIQIWNKNHSPMTNGSGLKGHSSSCQSALIIKQPNQKDSIYYIFTTDEYISSNGFNYSIVNINQSNSFGSVTTKNILIEKNVTEKLTATQNPNSDVYWIATNIGFKGEYRVYKFDSNGININSYTTLKGDTTYDTRSQSKFSLNTKKYANIVRSKRKIELMDFNNVTGTLSNLISLQTTYEAYGLEFSPSGNYLYVTCNNNSTIGNNDGMSYLISFDLTAKDIQASQKVVKSISNLSGYNLALLGMQLAPDLKVYVSIGNQQFLGVITNPDLPFDQCNFIYNGFILGKGACMQTLPNILYPLAPYLINKSNITICEGDSLILDANLSQTITVTYFWYGPNNYISNDKVSNIPNITPDREGVYYVEATDGLGRKYKSFIKVTVIPKDNVKILSDNNFQICDNNPIILKLSKKPNNILWNNKSKLDFISINKLGTYSVKYWDINGSCTFTESVNVTTGSKPNVKINIIQTGDDCFTVPYVISADKDYKTYLWSNGATTKQTNIFNKGKFSLKVTNDFGCEGIDSITINTGNKPIFLISAIPSNTFCSGQNAKIDLQPKLPNSTYLWSTGETTDNINVNKSGVFNVVVIDKSSGCRDSLLITTTQLPEIKGKILGNKNLCSNSANQLTASLIGAGYTYLWSNGANTNSINVNTAGKYWLKTTLNNNCFAYDTLDIINENTDFNIIGPSSICNNENGTLTLDKNFKNYLWSTGSITKSININKAGDYSCTITTTNGCNNSKKFHIDEKIIDYAISQSSISFSNININTSASSLLLITNNSKDKIDIKISNKLSNFKTSNTNISLNSSATILNFVTFTPTNFIDYYDTLFITTNLPCVTTTKIPLFGSGIANAELSISNLTATPNMTDFEIPINFRLIDNIKESYNLNLDYEVLFSRLPFKSKNQIGVNSGSKNILKYNFNSVYSGNSNNFDIEKLIGDVLLGDTTFYNINLKNVKSNNKNLNLLVKSGSLNIIGLCSPNIRVIENIELFEFSINPNPANGELNFTFNNDYNCDIKLEFYDVMGNLISNSFDKKSNREFSKLISLANFNSGIYFIKIYLNGYITQTKQINVIK